MSCTRNQLVAQMQAFLGCKESDGSHKKIIDLYNSHKPRARGYKLKYTDAWCAGTVGAAAVACCATDIIPMEVSVSKLITLARKKGIWVERDDHIPMPGDLPVYAWGDSGKDDCKSGASHVGVVEKVEESRITVIEGNYANAVKRRVIEVDGRYIRGYITPMYDPELPVEEGPVKLTMRVLQKGDAGADVLALQILLKGLGCNGSMHKNLDGKFGNNTRGAVLLYQRKMGLPQTGAADTATWQTLLEVTS